MDSHQCFCYSNRYSRFHFVDLHFRACLKKSAVLTSLGRDALLFHNQSKRTYWTKKQSSGPSWPSITQNGEAAVLLEQDQELRPVHPMRTLYKFQKHENVFEELLKTIRGPVDFDLPSSLKEWKLGYYVPIKRNVYLTKRRIEDDGIFCSCTPLSGSSIACDGDCQCGMLFSCCSSSCKCDSNCANKSFQHRPLKKMKLITTEKCGLGLVAEEVIKKGEFVIEYVGEVIDDRTCEERLWKMKRQRDTNFYLCEVSSNMVIDATNKGNVSRFINHSCEPNTVMQKWRVDGETRVGIFALRDIKEGEELTYDYKFVQFGADQDCHCGSSICRKMLGINKAINPIIVHNGNSGSSQLGQVMKKRQTAFENCIGEIVRVWHRRDKMYVAAYVYDFDAYSGLHTLMYVDETTEKFDLSEEDWDFLPLPGELDGIE